MIVCYPSLFLWLDPNQLLIHSNRCRGGSGVQRRSTEGQRSVGGAAVQTPNQADVQAEYDIAGRSRVGWCNIAVAATLKLPIVDATVLIRSR